MGIFSPPRQFTSSTVHQRRGGGGEANYDGNGNGGEEALIQSQNVDVETEQQQLQQQQRHNSTNNNNNGGGRSSKRSFFRNKSRTSKFQRLLEESASSSIISASHKYEPPKGFNKLNLQTLKEAPTLTNTKNTTTSGVVTKERQQQPSTQQQDFVKKIPRLAVPGSSSGKKKKKQKSIHDHRHKQERVIEDHSTANSTMDVTSASSYHPENGNEEFRQFVFDKSFRRIESVAVEKRSEPGQSDFSDFVEAAAKLTKNFDSGFIARSAWPAGDATTPCSLQDPGLDGHSVSTRSFASSCRRNNNNNSYPSRHVDSHSFNTNKSSAGPEKRFNNTNPNNTPVKFRFPSPSTVSSNGDRSRRLQQRQQQVQPRPTGAAGQHIQHEHMGNVEHDTDWPSFDHDDPFNSSQHEEISTNGNTRSSSRSSPSPHHPPISGRRGNDLRSGLSPPPRNETISTTSTIKKPPQARVAPVRVDNAFPTAPMDDSLNFPGSYEQQQRQQRSYHEENGDSSFPTTRSRPRNGSSPSPSQPLKIPSAFQQRLAQQELGKQPSSLEENGTGSFVNSKASPSLGLRHSRGEQHQHQRLTRSSSRHRSTDAGLVAQSPGEGNVPRSDSFATTASTFRSPPRPRQSRQSQQTDRVGGSKINGRFPTEGQRRGRASPPPANTLDSPGSIGKPQLQYHHHDGQGLRQHNATNSAKLLGKDEKGHIADPNLKLPSPYRSRRIQQNPEAAAQTAVLTNSQADRAVVDMNNGVAKTKLPTRNGMRDEGLRSPPRFNPRRETSLQSHPAGTPANNIIDQTKSAWPIPTESTSMTFDTSETSTLAKQKTRNKTTDAARGVTESSDDSFVENSKNQYGLGPSGCNTGTSGFGSVNTVNNSMCKQRNGSNPFQTVSLKKPSPLRSAAASALPSVMQSASMNQFSGRFSKTREGAVPAARQQQHSKKAPTFNQPPRMVTSAGDSSVSSNVSNTNATVITEVEEERQQDDASHPHARERSSSFGLEHDENDAFEYVAPPAAHGRGLSDRRDSFEMNRIHFNGEAHDDREPGGDDHGRVISKDSEAWFDVRNPFSASGSGELQFDNDKAKTDRDGIVPMAYSMDDALMRSTSHPSYSSGVVVPTGKKSAVADIDAEGIAKGIQENPKPSSPHDIQQSQSDSVLDDRRSSVGPQRAAPKGLPNNAILASMLFRSNMNAEVNHSPWGKNTAESSRSKVRRQQQPKHRLEQKFKGMKSADFGMAQGYEDEAIVKGYEDEIECVDDNDDGEDADDDETTKDQNSIPRDITADKCAESTVSSVSEEASSFYQKTFQVWNKQASNALNQYHMRSNNRSPSKALSARDTNAFGMEMIRQHLRQNQLFSGQREQQQQHRQQHRQQPRPMHQQQQNMQQSPQCPSNPFNPMLQQQQNHQQWLERVEEEHMNMFTA